MSLSSARDITRAVNPPRAAYLDYPLGHTAGRPHQPQLNKVIIRGALRAFEQLSRPGTMVHLAHRWSDDDRWKDWVMRPRPRDQGGTGEMEDDRVERHPDPQYQSQADEAAAAQTHQGQACLVCAGIDY